MEVFVTPYLPNLLEEPHGDRQLLLSCQGPPWIARPFIIICSLGNLYAKRSDDVLHMVSCICTMIARNYNPDVATFIAMRRTWNVVCSE
jgi:hypothetical protein